VTSAYTRLDLGRCTQIERIEEGSSAVWRCPGYAGVPLYVETGDERFDLDAGTRDQDALWSETFDTLPTMVEWRLSGGKPFAIIYRLTVANPDRPKTSRLLVESIGRRAKFGCRIADIAGATARANAVARRAATKILNATATCIES
jgi:hypothetical protein